MLKKQLSLLLLLFFCLTSMNIYAVVDSSEVKGKNVLPASYFNSGAIYGENSAVAKVLSTDKVVNISFKNPYTNNSMSTSAGTFKGEINSVGNIKFYCIDISHNLAFYTSGQPHTYIDAGNTPSEITYILNNYYPYKSLPYAGSLSETNEAASVQVALWHFADGLDANTVNKSAIKDRALQIIADAEANAGGVTPVATLVVTPASQEIFVSQNATLKVYAYDEVGNVLPNVPVTLTTTSGVLSATTGVTNAQGYFEFTLTQGSVNSADVTAFAQVVVPQGTRYVHSVSPNQYQKLVLATPASAIRQFKANVKWLERTDLKLNKVTSNSNPTNGDVITFTITVTNDGPTPATGIEVTDLVDAAFEIQSVVASKGTYNETTGVWTVGSLTNGSSATLTMSVKVNVTNVFTTPIDLGVASDFNVFVFEDINQPSSDTQGKMAAGKDIFLKNYSVGDQLPIQNNFDDVLIAGRNLTYLTGRVYNGNVVYGLNSNLPVDYVSVDGTVRQDSVIDFAAAEAHLLGLSASLATYPVNGTDSLEWSTLTLNGSSPVINVFDISGADVTNSTGIVINVPSGSTVIVNISGDNIELNGGLDLYGASKVNTLYNFYEATNLVINNIDVVGSILAPKADVNFVDGVINGQFIAKSVVGKGQFNLCKFIGNIPGVTELNNIAEITSADQLDPDSEPGNGITTEDDYAIVSLSINPNLTVGSGSNANWEYVGGFGTNEIMWVITRDINNDLIAGTFGGKIYRSEDEGINWTRINEGMTVGYIWSLKVNAAGDIFAATENGIYASTDNGATWASFALAGKDVRALLLTNTAMFAGIWGEGVAKSVNNGVDWTLKNEGLDFTAVNTLAINSLGDLFVGTFGGGIYKSSDNADSWTKMDISYAHIWSIAINAADEIYAATYGAGLYYSPDGASFLKVTSVNAAFIYSVSIDNGIVVASAWNGGVYVLPPVTKDGWQTLGMEGFNISSVMVEGNMLYAGTSDGRLYRNNNPYLAVEDETNSLNYSFELQQNYPNPFNPSTIIKYSIAENTTVKLKIYDVLGKEVTTLVNSELQAGQYQMVWNGTNNYGQKVASGIYFYTLEAGKFNKTNKMILMK